MLWILAIHVRRSIFRSFEFLMQTEKKNNEKFYTKLSSFSCFVLLWSFLFVVCITECARNHYDRKNRLVCSFHIQNKIQTAKGKWKKPFWVNRIRRKITYFVVNKICFMCGTRCTPMPMQKRLKDDKVRFAISTMKHIFMWIHINIYKKNLLKTNSFIAHSGVVAKRKEFHRFIVKLFTKDQNIDRYFHITCKWKKYKKDTYIWLVAFVTYHQKKLEWSKFKCDLIQK